MSKSDKWLISVDIATGVFLVAIAVLYQDYLKLSLEVNRVRSELNNTPYADTSGLIFNRNPKTGSETIWALLDALANVNNFTSYSDSAEVKEKRGGENTFMWKTSERHNYIKLLSIDSETNMSRPFSYVKHINFLDLSELNYTNPVYINFVRHPVDRVISWYYYIRQPTYIIRVDKSTNETELIDKRISLRSLKKSFEDCVLDRDDECIYEQGQHVYVVVGSPRRGGSHFSQIGFFCGMAPECNIFESDEGLATAKRNVEKHYAVVGVLEKMQESLEVLENFVPLYFRNARAVYKEMMKETHVNKNQFKPKTPTYIRNMLMKNFTKEIEFYEFCKQRLYRQYLSLN